MPLISTEEAVERLELNNRHHPQVKRTISIVCRTNSKLKLFLSKGLLCGLGVLVFVAGCILLVTFQHGDVDEMCASGDGYSATGTNVTSTSYGHGAVSPTSTSSILIDQLQTFTSF